MREPKEGDIEREIVPRAICDKVDAELAFHVEMRTRDLIARGVGDEEVEDAPPVRRSLLHDVSDRRHRPRRET